MINDEHKSEIRVKSFQWKQKMLITGYYEFEIIIRNIMKNSEKTIYRRFSDIELLHEGLLKYNPGCRIPNLPEKNIWANISVNNVQILEKRRKLIEEYLNYINNHKYMHLNPNFQMFLSDDFEKTKTENLKKTSVFEKFTNLTSMIPGMFKSQKMKGLSTIEDNKNLEKERENLVRLLKAINELNSNMQDYIKINEEKTESIKNIIFSTKSLKYVSLDYNVANEFRNDEDSSSIEKSINKNLDVINSYFDKNKIFYNLIVSNIQDQLEKYEEELKGLIEIFDRKEKEENKLTLLQKEERSEENEREINDLKFQLENFNNQLCDEIKNFKLTRENDLLLIIKRIFKDKADCNLEINQIFEGNNPYNNLIQK